MEGMEDTADKTTLDSHGNNSTCSPNCSHSDHSCRRGFRYTHDEKAALALLVINSVKTSDKLNIKKICEEAVNVVEGRTVSGLIGMCQKLLIQAAAGKTPYGLKDEERKALLRIGRVYLNLRVIKRNAFSNILNNMNNEDENVESQDGSVSLNMDMQNFNDDTSVDGENQVTRENELVDNETSDAVAQIENEMATSPIENEMAIAPIENEMATAQIENEMGGTEEGEEVTNENVEVPGALEECKTSKDNSDDNKDIKKECFSTESSSDDSDDSSSSSSDDSKDSSISDDSEDSDKEFKFSDSKTFKRFCKQEAEKYQRGNDDHDYGGGGSVEDTDKKFRVGDNLAKESNCCEGDKQSEELSERKIKMDVDKGDNDQIVEEGTSEALNLPEICDEEVVESLLNELANSEVEGMDERIIAEAIDNVFEGFDDQNKDSCAGEAISGQKVLGKEDENCCDIDDDAVQETNKCQMLDMNKNSNAEEANRNEDEAINGDAEKVIGNDGKGSNCVSVTENCPCSKVDEEINDQEVSSDVDKEIKKNYEVLGERDEKTNNDREPGEISDVDDDDVKPNIFNISNNNEESLKKIEMITLDSDFEAEVEDEDCKVVFQKEIVVTLGSGDESCSPPPKRRRRRRKGRNREIKEVKVEIVQLEENCESRPAFPVEESSSSNDIVISRQLQHSENSPFKKPTADRVWQPWRILDQSSGSL